MLFVPRPACTKFRRKFSFHVFFLAHCREPRLQKLELQRAAIDCLSIVISRAGPEMMDMLLAHRVPAVLCACIRRQPPGGHSAREETGPSMIKTAASGHTSSTSSSSRGSSDRMPPLARSAVHALALLVHPRGPQWAPIRAMPFREATSEQTRSRNGVAVADAGVAATASGLAVYIKAAAELGASVWRETSMHLLKTARTGSGGRDGGGGGDSMMPETARGGEGRGGGGSGSDPYFVGTKVVATSALSVLCAILCEDAHCDGLTTVKRDCSQNTIAPSSDESLRGLAVRPRDDAAAVRLAALRVLLHTCRSSADVAHEFAAFGGGVAVQALLARLCLPINSSTSGGGKVRHAELHTNVFLSEIGNKCRVWMLRSEIVR